MPIAKFNIGDRVVFSLKDTNPNRRFSGKYGKVINIFSNGSYHIQAETHIKEVLACSEDELVLVQDTSPKSRTYTITLDDQSYVEVLQLIVKHGIESNLSLKAQVAFATAKVDLI